MAKEPRDSKLFRAMRNQGSASVSDSILPKLDGLL